MNKRSFFINTDGGARGNPGPAAWAYVVKEIKDDGETIIHKQDSGYLGVSTNNQAEYAGVLNAFKWLLENSKLPSYVTFILDSELVVKQLTGVYKIKDKNLQRVASEIKEYEQKLDFKIFYTIVRREHNKEADALVNEKLDMESEN